MRFTKTSIEQLPAPQNERYKIYRDEKLTGFCLRVTENGLKTFIIDKKMGNKLHRVTIGRYGQLTVEQARKLAQKSLGQLCMGIDPQAEKRQDHKINITLEKAFNDYLMARNSLRTRTIKDYHSIIDREFSDWKCIKLNSISKAMVIKRHQDIGKKTTYGANNAFKLISAIFNFAIYHYEDEKGQSPIKQNPVITLSKIRAWYPKKRKRTKIETHELARWFNVVIKLRNRNRTNIAKSVKLYLLVLLFTGLRRNEAIDLIWIEHKSSNCKIAEKQNVIDLKAKTLLIPDPKNGQEHLLPLPNYLVELLKESKDNNKSIYVFPNATGESHFKEPQKVIAQVIKDSGVKFTLHDLRRTFISIAESLDVPAYALKRLLNHKIISSDVTAGYIVSDVERLRRPVQMVADFILKTVSNQN